LDIGLPFMHQPWHFAKAGIGMTLAQALASG
jgi:hypothetical protein